MPAHPLQAHYEDLEKQTHAARLGMWVFIGSEALLFSTLFTLYAAYRVAYPDAFRDASAHTDLLLGTLMTVVLITSSYAVVAGLHAARQARLTRIAPFLGVAIALGLAFLGLKGMEYALHFQDGIYPGRYYRFEALPGDGARTFFTLYYFMTGLHALHVAGGLVLLAGLAWLARRGRFGPEYHTPLELGGLYWHFVDVIWIILWPIFYLLR